MRRSTTSSRRPSSSARRAPTRSRAPRRARRTGPAKPLLTPTQLREAAGVLVFGLGLLLLAAQLTGGGPLLAGLHRYATATFGAGWPLPVAALLALGAIWIYPRSPRMRLFDLAGGLAAAAAVLGLMSLVARSGGSSGLALAAVLTELAGTWGAGILLSAALLLGLIVALRFSPGAILLGAATTVRAGYAERRRLEALVRPPGRRPDPSDKPDKPTKAVAQAVAPALAAAGALKADWAPDAEEEAPHPALTEPAPDAAEVGAQDQTLPVMRVLADIEDELPDIEWKLPPISLLDSVTAKKERMQDEIKRNVRVIESTLQTFGVHARVIGVNPGPAVTQYELQPGAGVPVKRIVALQNDLSLALAASPLRIEAPIPGKSAVGIEVPNKSASLVSIREVVESAAFSSGSKFLALALGNDVSGTGIVGDLTKMPHLLIAGATGQGKSVCVNVIIASLLFQCTPEHLRLVLIDPKRVELSGFNGLPHLAVPVIVESHQAAAALRWAVAEMDRRYKLLAGEGVRSIQAYNQKAVQQAARELPYVVIVIDELADLMMVAAGEIEELVCRIAQLARAVGIHLVIATQRPSTDIITGLIKANIPSRIAFSVSSQIDSRVILDSGGAEKLLGKGDMLYQPVDAGKPTRIQGAFISDPEVESLIRFWRSQGEPHYMEEVLDDAVRRDFEAGGAERKLDPLFARAARAVAAEGGASVSLVQRKFNVGYSRAGRIVDMLAEHRVIGGYQGSKSREVLMNLPDVDDLLQRLGLE